MQITFVQIGDHVVQFRVQQHGRLEHFQDFFNSCHRLDDAIPPNSDLVIDLKGGYGCACVDYEVQIEKEDEVVRYTRQDYCIEAELSYSKAAILVYDGVALKHAIMNLYSAYIVHHRWGLLLHSSCILHEHAAHIFAGEPSLLIESAELFITQQLLSNEATLVRITSSGVKAYPSPMSSKLESERWFSSQRVASIQLLHRAAYDQRTRVAKREALLLLMSSVFYWSHDPDETSRVIWLLGEMIRQTPVYELRFHEDIYALEAKI